MGPKRSRTTAGSSADPNRAYNHDIFVSAEAADRFDTVVAKRSLLPERGLDPSPQDGSLLDMIRGKNWETLTQQPDPACTAIVKEFYANAQDTPECEARVRGRTVSFSRAAINAYYNLQPPTVCQYSELIPDFGLIVRSLTQPGTEWSRNRRTGEIKLFPSSNLGRYGKAWHYFICAKLLPSTHHSDVSVDRAKLMYAIVQGLDIDIGNVIETSIRQQLKGSIMGGLPHPSLITELCRAAGVRWGDTEPFSMPTAVMDHNMIKRLDELPNSVSHPRGLGYLSLPPQGPSSMPGPSTSSAPPSSDSMNFARMATQIETMQRNQQAMMQYTSETNVAWIRFFSQQYPGADMSYFPRPPTMAVYPPQTEADNDDDDEA